MLKIRLKNLENKSTVNFSFHNDSDLNRIKDSFFNILQRCSDVQLKVNGYDNFECIFSSRHEMSDFCSWLGFVSSF